MELSNLTSPAFSDAVAGCPAVIIPFGSVEAHGLHLPLSTDTAQVLAVARAAADEAGILCAPPVHFGVCTSTRNHPGTIGISPASLRRLTRDLVRSFRKQGVRVFVLISGHAGRSHLMALRDAAHNLIENDTGLHVAVISEYDLVSREGAGLISTPDDRHAGEIETSRMLHLDPGSVRGSSPPGHPSFADWVIERDPISVWPGSVWGNPAAASPEKGRRLTEMSVRAVVGVIRAMLDRARLPGPAPRT